MRVRRLLAVGASAALVVTFGSLGSASAEVDNLGEFTVGDTVTFTFECPFDGNFFGVFIDNSKVDERSIDASADYLLGYQYDTSGLEPGTYSVGIECNDAQGIFDYEFTLVAADPCAPVVTVEVPKGPSRAPHGAPIECQDSGIPLTGSSDTTTILMLGTVAIVAGTGLLIARRRTLA